MRTSRRSLLVGMATLPLVARRAAAQAASDWTAVTASARGQTVFWNAWAGDERTNAFIAWAADRVRGLHGVEVRHVKLRDTSEAVARIVAERAAGRTEGGSVDLVWINGPNFLALKQQGLLFGPVVARLPNAALLDTAGKPVGRDFTVPVEGYEVPWRMARIVFVVDAAKVVAPPRTMGAMLDWARAHPGRLAHPTARNFLGATFLKQALVELTPDPSLLASAATDATYAAATRPLWTWYDALRPALWRQGLSFPENGPATRTLMNDGEVDLMVSFNPSEAAADIADDSLPKTVRAYVLAGGTIGNCSFNAIPYDAAHKEGAMVLANFLLSPEAQARAADPRVLGSPSVLDVAHLPAADRALFAAATRDVPGALSDEELGRALAEPHPSWMTRVVAEWQRRVGA